MSWIPARLLRKFRRNTVARELDAHLEMEAAEQQDNGLTREEASYAARRAFGNRTLIEEEMRLMNCPALLTASCRMRDMRSER